MESGLHNHKNFDEALAALEQADEVRFELQELKARVRKAELEPGLLIYTWYFTFKEEYTFVHKHRPGKEHYQLLVCQFSPLLSHVQLRGEVEKEWRVSEPYYLLLGSESEVAFRCRKGSRAQSLTILMTRNWLQHQLQSAGSTIANRPLHEPRTEPLLNIMASHQVEQATQLYNALKENHSLLSLKAGVYQLLSLFMEAGKNKMQGPADLLRDAEAYILSCLHTHLPPLEELAKICNMSISSFKRNFKKKHSTGVSEYYLARKMELARDMIVHKHMNVGQVAFELGYESFSHFSHIFFKHFNEHPGNLKTRTGNNPDTK